MRDDSLVMDFTVNAASGPRHKFRVSTGVPGLDDILAGGFPGHRMYLIEGNPGTGKTTLALQFLMDGVRRGERVLYVTLSETEDELHDVAQSHGWSLDGIALYELNTLQEQGEEEYTVFHPAEVELGETTKRILARVEQLGPTRVVFDSLSELRLLAQGPLRYRREVLSLKQFFAGRQCTVLLLDDRTSQDNDLQLQSICHGVVRLERIDADYGITRRRVHVLKMRGVRFRDGYHDYQITTGGLSIYPRLIAAEHRPAYKREQIGSGVPGLDGILGGGLDRGTSALLIGPAGSGKSSIATQFAVQAASRGEHTACYIFEENTNTFLQRALGMGMDVAPLIEAGKIHLQQIDPAEVSPGEFSTNLRQSVEKHGTRLVVIDSLNGYFNALPSEHFLNIQMHELLTYLAQQGVVTILVLAQHGMLGPMDSPVEVSYLADTVLLLRYFEAAGEVRQALSVVKKRTGPHERTIRELRLSTQGIFIGEPLREFSGILTGVPRYSGNVAPLLKNSDDDGRS
ncbi:MAG TPA: ATPase domain-containing protein [Bryobacteraceae bacterium]|nr:ATPase domain-containing protein [Bryobacteraceae bacterium]